MQRFARPRAGFAPLLPARNISPAERATVWVERAVIFARGGALDFDVPGTGTSVDLTSFGPRRVDQSEPEYLTESEIRRRERDNVFAVLQKTSWKIKGVDGAAELLGVKPNTLFARIEKMGLKRPA
jgi:transcriptional regulator with GAF, ATPase, and Fis domain